MEINEQDFGKEVLNSEEPVLIDFWAPWCGPCKALSPVVEELEVEYGEDVKFYKVNVDENPQISSQFNVRAVPTLVIWDSGEVKDFMVGMQSKANIADKLKQVI